jgi:hypothetical protein
MVEVATEVGDVHVEGVKVRLSSGALICLDDVQMQSIKEQIIEETNNAK